MLPSRKIGVFLLFILFAAVLNACNSPETNASDLHMASLDSMPAEVQDAPIAVQQAYQFAVANPEIMTSIPCYCGCGAIGHTSNYACYVSGMDEQNNVLFDTHALGCSICVDITQDAMHMASQGKSVIEIRAFVDQTYARYGQSNMP